MSDGKNIFPEPIGFHEYFRRLIKRVHAYLCNLNARLKQERIAIHSHILVRSTKSSINSFSAFVSGFGRIRNAYK
jgi:hypothetical protein